MELKDSEVQLALRLIDQTTTDGFHPERYQDAVRQRTLEAIERKVQGQEIQVSAPAEPRGEVIDIMDALKASLEAAARGPSTESSSRAGKGEPAEDRPAPTPRRKAAHRADHPGEGRARASSASKK